MEEIWKDIEGYEDLYQVSNLGRVKSLPKEWVAGKGVIQKHHGMILKTPLSSNGYYFVSLYKNNISKTYKVHRLVGLAFISNDNNKACLNHIDGNKKNNYVDNLEWVSHQQNNQHAYDTGLKKSKLTEKEVLEIRASNLNGVELAKIYNVNRVTIYAIKKNNIWKHI